ncbi:MAG: stage II sporulation protein P [Bacillota bacterium]
MSGLRWAGRKAYRPFHFWISPIPVLIIVFGAVIFLFVSFFWGSPGTGGVDRQPVAAEQQDSHLIRLLTGVSVETLKGVLRQGMLVVAVAGEIASIERQPGDLLQSTVKTLAQVDVFDPRSFLASQLAVLDVVPVAAAPVVARYVEDEGAEAQSGQLVELPPEEEAAQPEPPPVVPSGSALVAIYNTHNAETYVPTDGKEKLEGKNGGVVKVAETLADVLSGKYGIKTARSEKIHDYPNWAKSYTNSEQTIKELISANPGIQVVLDIHRDAGLKQKESVVINGKETARVLLIVGSDKRLDHPAWRQNLKFAQRLAAKVEALYPGLSKGVRIQDGRYNQHLHQRAVLLEIGSTRNSLEEAKRAAELVAHVVAEVLRDMGIKPGN